jgi:hypothetical protein
LPSLCPTHPITVRHGQVKSSIVGQHSVRDPLLEALNPARHGLLHVALAQVAPQHILDLFKRLPPKGMVATIVGPLQLRQGHLVGAHQVGIKKVQHYQPSFCKGVKLVHGDTQLCKQTGHRKVFSEILYAFGAVQNCGRRSSATPTPSSFNAWRRIRIQGFYGWAVQIVACLPMKSLEPPWASLRAPQRCQSVRGNGPESIERPAICN